MNKRKLKTIINMYKDGVSCEVCIAMILDLLEKENNTNLIKGTYIHMFYEKISILKKDLRENTKDISGELR